MKNIPQYVRRLPHILYAGSIIIGVWRTYNEWSLADLAMQYSEAGGANALSKSISLYWGVVDSVFLIASAAMIHVLIAIYDKLSGKGE